PRSTMKRIGGQSTEWRGGNAQARVGWAPDTTGAAREWHNLSVADRDLRSGRFDLRLFVGGERLAARRQDEQPENLPYGQRPVDESFEKSHDLVAFLSGRYAMPVPHWRKPGMEDSESDFCAWPQSNRSALHRKGATRP